jgi:hypothetical protein
VAIDLRTAEITGLHLSVLNTEGYIDRALDLGDMRGFRVWCRRRASLTARLQRILIITVTNGTSQA